MRFDVRFLPLAEYPLLAVNPSGYLAFFEFLDIGVSLAGETTKKKGIPDLGEPVAGELFIRHQIKFGAGKDRFIDLLKLAPKVQIRIKIHPAIPQANVDDLTKHFHMFQHCIIAHLTNRAQIKLVVSDESEIDPADVKVSRVEVHFQECECMAFEYFVAVECTYRIFLSDQSPLSKHRHAPTRRVRPIVAVLSFRDKH